MPKRKDEVKRAWSAVVRGMDTKSAAIEYGCSRCHLERKARDIGMRRRLVTDAEFDQVRLHRLTTLTNETALRSLNDR